MELDSSLGCTVISGGIWRLGIRVGMKRVCLPSAEATVGTLFGSADLHLMIACILYAVCCRWVFVG